MDTTLSKELQSITIPKEEKTFGVEVRHNIKITDVESLLVSAFEGGSNYWYMIEKKVSKEDSNKDIYETVLEGQGLYISNEYGISKGENKTIKILNMDSIKKGTKIIAKKYPEHFSDGFLKESGGDCITGDIFLQCCLFGKVIYG